MESSRRPRIHGRDHLPGGADPIPASEGQVFAFFDLTDGPYIDTGGGTDPLINSVVGYRLEAPVSGYSGSNPKVVFINFTFVLGAVTADGGLWRIVDAQGSRAWIRGDVIGYGRLLRYNTAAGDPVPPLIAYPLAFYGDGSYIGIATDGVEPDGGWTSGDGPLTSLRYNFPYDLLEGDRIEGFVQGLVEESGF